MRQALPTLVLQLAFASLTLAFGLLALRVAPRPGHGVRLDGWFLTGATFATIGLLATLADVLAFGAVAAGPGSAPYTAFVRLNPVANDARSFAVLGFALAMAQLVMQRRPAPGRRSTAAGLALLLGIGAVVGVLEGPFVPEQQFPVMEMLGAATSLALFIVLYAALVRDVLDWPLWCALALYAAREAMNVNVQALLTRAGMDGYSGPSHTVILWSGVASVVPMLAFTLYRLQLAQAGREAPGLLERLRR